MSDSHLLSKKNILPTDYQKPLVSGTDIKTVNSNSLLGSGNISLQEPITGAASSVLSSNLTESRAVISNANGKLDVSSTTSTELGYVHGVTSNIQAQLNGKANVDLSNLSATGEAHFQSKLVSGTNIKTINGNSILGSGDLTISGGANTSLSNLSATGEAHFANPSLSNVNSTGKATAVGWGMPNYAAGQDVTASVFATSGVGFKPSVKGLLMLKTRNYVAASDFWFYAANGTLLFTKQFNSSEGSFDVSGATTTIPMTPDFSIRIGAQAGTAGSNYWAIFFPYKA